MLGKHFKQNPNDDFFAPLRVLITELPATFFSTGMHLYIVPQEVSRAVPGHHQRSFTVKDISLVDVYAILPEKQFDDVCCSHFRGYPKRSFTVDVGLVDVYAIFPEKQFDDVCCSHFRGYPQRSLTVQVGLVEIFRVEAF